MEYPDWFTTDHEASMRGLERKGSTWVRMSWIHYNPEVVYQLHSYGLIEKRKGADEYRIKQPAKTDCKMSDFDKDKLTQSVTKLRELHNNIKLLSMRYSDCAYAPASENTIRMALKAVENFLIEVSE